MPLHHRSAILAWQEYVIKIAVVAHIRHVIAEPFMGGMESHCHGLVAGLEARGHAVTLFAAAGSQASHLSAICAEPCEAIFPWSQPDLRPQLTRYQSTAFKKCWREIKRGGFDVVHNNSLFPELMEWAARDSIAMVTSQHVPPFGRMREYAAKTFGDDARQMTVTSTHQRTLWAANDIANVSVVHNGISTEAWLPTEKRHGRLMWYGRIAETKGLRETIQAARRAKVALDIVGTIEEPSYFADHVSPYLDQTIRYLGHLSGAALRNAVASARAAVVTPMWDEPFGLVAAEALSSGVPIIAFDRGAMREVVGDCGIIVPADNVDALSNAMMQSKLPSRAKCRERAQEHFSIERMLDNYERCYRSAMQGAATELGSSL